jgi:hypothetical protein
MTGHHQRIHELGLANQIQQLLHDNPDLQLYALIDGTISNIALDQFFLLAPEAEYEPLFLDTQFASCLPHSPYLVHLARQDLTYLLEFGYWSESQILWLLSEQSLSAQADFWRSLLTVITPDDRVAVLRFWSAPILASLLVQSNDAERAELLGGCRYLFTPDSQRHWTCWSGTDMTQDTRRTPAPWWQLREHHLAAFAASFERLLVDAIEDHLWRTEAASLQSIYPPLLPHLISEGNAIARSLGLRSDTALTQFARCRMRFGPEFWRDPRLADLWSPPDTDEQAFAEWVRQVLTATNPC